MRSDLTSLETSHEASNARQTVIRADLDSLSAVMDDTRNAYATRAEVNIDSYSNDAVRVENSTIVSLLGVCVIQRTGQAIR